MTSLAIVTFSLPLPKNQLYLFTFKPGPSPSGQTAFPPRWVHEIAKQKESRTSPWPLQQLAGLAERCVKPKSCHVLMYLASFFLSSFFFVFSWHPVLCLLIFHTCSPSHAHPYIWDIRPSYRFIYVIRG